MRKFRPLFAILAVAAFLLAACGGQTAANNVMANDSGSMDGNMMNSSDNMVDDMSTNGSQDMMEENDSMANDPHDAMDDSMSNSTDAMMEEESDQGTGMMEEAMAPPWFDHEFTNAVTGETFSINSLRGKVVLLETMAMWCSNCMSQQRQVRELHNLLGERDDFIGIGIDVDLNEDIVNLAGYSQKNDFHWYYSVADQDVLSGISDTLGGQFLNPPSTPIVIIDKDGNMHPLPFGIKSADELLTAVQMYLD